MKELQQIKQGIIEICSIDSVQSAPEAGKPFGAGVYQALEYALNEGKRMGFETINYDGYIGEIIWRGTKDGEPGMTMGILCHLDVVKPGRLSDWKYPPFTPTEENGKIYARGTTDDKGPAIIVLHVLNALKQEGFVPEKTIKLILGCNEESGWGCIAHYNKVAKMPDFGFSPDGDFPVLYAEKGIVHANYTFDCSEKIKELAGGEMANMVCDYAYAIAPIDNVLIQKHGLTITGEKIESFGKSAHGSMPERGVNAIDTLLLYLTELNLVDSHVHDALFKDKFNLKQLQDETGKLTMSPNVIRAGNKKLKISVDFRYPATLNPDEMLEKLANISPKTFESHHQKPLYNKKDGHLIQTLLKIYNEETGENREPMAIGGGTYARALPIGVAFGPEFPGEDACIHQPNEFISVEHIKTVFKIYKRAIKELC